MNPSKETQFAIDLAKQAGKVLMEYFGTELTRNIKTGPNDYATEADVAAEKIILEQLKEAFPQDAIVAEESGKHEARDSQYTWIVDPLDGTRNFANNKKNFAVMICRARGNEIELAVVYSPANDVLATAEKGKGAYLQGKQVDLTGRDYSDKPLGISRSAQARITSLDVAGSDLGAGPDTLEALAGNRQGYITNNGYDWDFAPPVLLLSEAGWRVTDVQGNPYRWNGKLEYGKPGVLAAPADLHSQLVTLMND
ncbi:MAG: inositol monophosphatase family protein [Candidatus Andersenbacteria bacterium]